MAEETKQEATTPSVDTADKTPSPAGDGAVADAPARSDDASTTQSGAPADTPRGKRGGQGERGGDQRRNRRQQRRGRRSGRRDERARSEFEQKIIGIRRVTRVMAGGRRFSFSVSMVIGDKKGRVGVGVGKAGDTQLAIEKAARDARKHLMTVPMNADHHIPHDVSAKFASSEVMILPAPGRGLVAGSSVRTVLELAGVRDVTAKLLSRSKNKLNNARATIKALGTLTRV